MGEGNLEESAKLRKK